MKSRNRALTDRERATISRLYAAGLEKRRIAEIIGRNEKTVFLALGISAPAKREKMSGPRAVRSCLMCGWGFQSSGPVERVCGRCKETEAWRLGI